MAIGNESIPDLSRKMSRSKTVIIDTFEDKIMVIVTFKYYGARFSEFSCDLMKQDSCII